MIYKPYCIDIYHGDVVLGANDEGFAQVKAAGIAFLDHKASQGPDKSGWDPLCKFRRQRWMDGAAISVTDVDGAVLSLQPRFGHYHFNGVGSAADEAANFVAAVRAAGYQAGDDLCLDWEDIGASGYQQPATWADEFCSRVEQWCGFATKIYGGDAPRQQLAQVSGALHDRFAARRPWICQYGNYNPAEVPLPWQGAGHQWQDDGDRYGPGPHTIAGLSGYCDNSTVIGGLTVAQMNAAWGGSVAAS